MERLKSAKEIEADIVASIEETVLFWESIYNKRQGFVFFSRSLSLDQQRRIIENAIKNNNLGNFIIKANINDVIALVKISDKVLDNPALLSKIKHFSPVDIVQIIKSIENTPSYSKFIMKLSSQFNKNMLSEVKFYLLKENKQFIPK